MVRSPILVFTIFVCANALAQDDVHPSLTSKFWVDVGGFYPDHEVSVSVEGAANLPDTEFNLDGEVGLSDRKPLWNIDIGWQFGKKWALSAQYFETSREGSHTLDEQIEWDDVVYEVGANINFGSEASVTRLYVSRKMLQPGHHDLRLGLGIHKMDISASINGDARLEDMTVEFQSNKVSATAPLPNLGAWYRYSPSDRWVFTARADWFHITFGDISGTLTDFLVGVNYRVFENFGIGLNYQRLRLHGAVDTEDWRGDLDVLYSGPQFLITGFW